MNLTEINLREKEFHNKLQSKTKGRFENIFYKALHNMYEDFIGLECPELEKSVVLQQWDETNVVEPASGSTAKSHNQ